MESFYDDGHQQRPQQRNPEYYTSQSQQQPHSFSKQVEQKYYPIGDSKDVDVGHTSIINSTNNNNDYDRNEIHHHDTEKQKHIYERRTNSYLGKTTSDQKQFIRPNFGHQQTLKEFGDYQDDKLSSPKKQDYILHPIPLRSEPNSSPGYTNETSIEKEISNRNQLFKNKTKHQELIRKLHDYDNSNQVNDTLSKAQTYLVESPKSHGELVKIFTKNHKINPNKFQDSSLTSPTEEHFQRILLNGNYDPISLKSMARRNSKTNKSSFIQHCEQLAAAEHHPPSYTGRFIDTIKKPVVHKKPHADIYQKNAYSSLKNFPFDSIAPVKNLHKKTITDNQVEIKYANNKFGKNNDFSSKYRPKHKEINNYNYDHNDDAGLCNKNSSLSQIKDETISDDKISNEQKEYSRLMKTKGSARSNRSKRSYNTHQSRKLEDMFNVQKSKCDIINVISDGMQKISQSRYNLISPGRPGITLTAAEKCSQTRTIHVDCSSNEKSINVSSISNSNIFEPMLKEYKKYHLHNIKEEAQRLERLEHLSNRIEI